MGAESRREDVRLFLGVDTGGSKSHAILADNIGHIWGAGKGGSGHWDGPEGMGGAYLELSRAVKQALERAQVGKKRIVAAGYGLKCVDFPEDIELLAPMVERLGVPGPYVIVNDGYVALRAGTSDYTGISVICGTGTIIVGRNQRGQTFQTISQGPAWGDVGGSDDFVRRATRAVGLEYLGRGKSTALTHRFLELYGASDVTDLVRRWMRQGAQRPDGRFAPLVFEVADAGDEVALSILADIGRELGANAAAVAIQLGLQSTRFPVVLAGGIFKSGNPSFEEAIISAVHSRAPKAYSVHLDAPPAVGGVLLAMELGAQKLTGGVRQRLIHESRDRPELQ
jgi:N-acetylglucosamine kinase-like BadF-type ATPase